MRSREEPKLETTDSRVDLPLGLCPGTSGEDGGGVDVVVYHTRVWRRLSPTTSGWPGGRGRGVSLYAKGGPTPDSRKRDEILRRELTRGLCTSSRPVVFGCTPMVLRAHVFDSPRAQRGCGIKMEEYARIFHLLLPSGSTCNPSLPFGSPCLPSILPVE